LASITTTSPEVRVLESARASTARFYHPELDLLRFFAFLMVFLHHAFPHEQVFWTNLGVPRLIANVLAAIGATGAFGVSVFFVLSSYLITELLLREKDLIGTLDIRSFYIRRILRIWPLYFAFLALAVALQWILPGQHVTLRAGLWFSLLAGNWFIVFHGFPSSVIFPLWSVSIEEQFYITWPAVVRRAGETTMLVIAGLLLAVATATRIYLGLHHVGESDAWCNTFVQLDPIVIGILLAVWLRGEIHRLSRLGRAALMLGGITGLAMGSMYFGIKNDPLTTTRLVLGYPSVAIGGGLLLLSVLRVKDGGSVRPLVYLGRISYGLYVFHVLGLLISNHLVSDQTGSLWRYALRVGVGLAATILMAAISYRWLETPFLRLKQRFTHVLSRPGG
jgi:peptidoglycan/LPS O-acetylase OafA/YrhL